MHSTAFIELASTKRQLTTYKRQVDEYTARSREKEAVDPNKVFVDIEGYV